MDTVKVSWSGGKDSTAAMILHHLEGHLSSMPYRTKETFGQRIDALKKGGLL